MTDLEKARLACTRLDMACDLLHQVRAVASPPRGVGGLLDHLPMAAADCAGGELRDAEGAAKEGRRYLSYVLEALEREAIQAAVKQAGGAQ